MSYAIIHMQKLKHAAIKGMQIHHQREKESLTNPDIDSEKKSLNYDLLNDTEINFTERVQEEIDKRYTGKRAIRKDAVRLCQFMVTSDKTFFDKLSPEEEKRYFEESVKFLQERYGKENIIYGIVHKDEKTPHLHVGMVPINQEGKLSAKSFFGKKTELQGLQSDFHTFITEKGFDLERGQQSDRKHIEIGRFKAQTAKKNLEELEKEYEELDKEITSLEDMTNELYLERYETRKQIKKLQESKGELVVEASNLASEATEKRSEVKVLSEELKFVESEYERIKGSLNEINKEYSEKQEDIEQITKKVELFKRAAVNQISVSEKKNVLGRSTGIIEVNKKDWKDVLNKAQLTEVFKSDNAELERKNEKLKKENEKLQVDLRETKSTNQTLEKENNLLKETVGRVKTLYKQKIPELSTVIGYIKAEILDKAKEMLFVKYFTDDERTGAQNFINDREEKEKARQREKVEKTSKQRQEYARKRHWDLER